MTQPSEHRRPGGDVDLDPSLGAFVFRVGRYGSDHGVLGAIRSLGSQGIHVHTSGSGRRSAADWSRHLRERVPFPSTAEVPALAAAFGDAAERLTDSAVLVVPTDDQAAIFVDEHRERLPDPFRAVTSPRGTARRLVDKHECARALAECGVPAPPGHVVDGAFGESELASIELPVVLKRLARTVSDDGEWSASTVVVRTAAELTAALAPLRADRARVLVQPYLEGRDWLCHAYFDEGGRPAFAHTACKIVSDTSGGATALAVTRRNDDVRTLLERLASHLAYVGPISADVRETPDGELYVLDVNPRLGACFRLFTGTGGLDVLRAGHLHASGRRIPPQEVPDGRYYLVEGAAPTARPSTRRRLAGATSVERAWRDLGDPLPGVVRAATALGSRLAGRFGGR